MKQFESSFHQEKILKELTDLKEKLKIEIDNLQKEGYKIDLKFFFETHGSELSKQNLKKLIKNSDIFIPEFLGWDENILSLYKGISRGFFTPQEIENIKNFFIKRVAANNSRLFLLNQETRNKLAQNISSIFINSVIQPFQELDSNKIFTLGEILELGDVILEVLTTLLKSNTEIGFADIPFSKIENYEEFLKAFFLTRKSLLETANFEEALNLLKTSLEKFSYFQKLRDNIIAANIPTTIVNLIKTNSHLQKKAKKENVNILIQLGAFHTGIKHLFNSSDFKTDFIFETTPFIYSYNTEIARRFYHNKEISKDLLAKALAEKLLSLDFQDSYPLRIVQNKTGSYFSKMVKQIIGPTNIENIKSLYENLKKVYKDLDKNKTPFKTPFEVWIEFFNKTNFK